MQDKPQGEETGIDDDGNKVLTFGKNKPQWISPTKLKFPSGKVVSIDPNEQSCELYNPNKYRVVFQNVHPNPEERIQHPILFLEPDGWMFLPHNYYTPWIEKIGSGRTEKINLVQNFGDQMFIGNKKISAPTTRKKLF
jgi:hypothetical protein